MFAGATGERVADGALQEGDQRGIVIEHTVQEGEPGGARRVRIVVNGNQFQ
jgi:hypothetical protein